MQDDDEVIFKVLPIYSNVLDQVLGVNLSPARSPDVPARSPLSPPRSDASSVESAVSVIKPG